MAKKATAKAPSSSAPAKAAAPVAPAAPVAAAPKPKAAAKATPASSATATPCCCESKPKVTHDMVAKRAYEIWESKGRPVGRDTENWQQAERELGLRK